MQPYQVILLILVIVGFVYVGIAVYVTGNAATISFKLKKRTEALNMVFALKQIRVVDVFSRLIEEGVSLSEEDERALSAYKTMKFTSRKEADLLKNIEITKDMYIRMKRVLNGNESGNPEIEKDLNLLNDSNSFYRSSIALYNSLATGLNYWMSIPFVGWIPFVFGLRKRKAIS